MGLKSFIIRRVLFSIPVLLGTSMILFVTINLLGNPVTIILHDNPSLSMEDVDRLTKYYDLDKPIFVRYLSWLWRLMHFQLGHSFVRGVDVSSMIVPWIWETLKLQLFAIFIALPLSIVMGMKAGFKQFSKLDSILSVVASIGRSIPPFVMGIILILLFSYYFPIFPSHGAYSFDDPIFGIGIVDELWHMALPALSLASLQFALFYRLVRSNIVEITRLDYITAARASGLKESAVRRQALRNALLPVVTYSGIWFGLSLGGAPVIETVFNWPGLGYLYVQSLIRLDINVVLAINTIIAVMVVLLSAITNILYAVIDPRIRID